MMNWWRRRESNRFATLIKNNLHSLNGRQKREKRPIRGSQVRYKYTGSGNDSLLAVCSRELLQADAKFVGFAMGFQVLPGDLAAPEPGHAPHHAAQCGLDTGRNLVVRRAVDNTVDERALLVAIGEGEIVFEVSVGRKLALDGRCLCRLLPRPLPRSHNLDGSGV